MTIDNEIQHLFYQAIENANEKKTLLTPLCTLANDNKKPIKLKSFIFAFSLYFFIFLSGFFFCFSLIPEESKSTLMTIETSQKKISAFEKKAFRQIVKKISLKEKKHPNSIHAELRKKFNYRSYLDLTQNQYQHIYSYLKTRI